MSRFLGDAWVSSGGFPPGTFKYWPPHLMPQFWEPEVLERAQRLRDERDDVVG